MPTQSRAYVTYRYSSAVAIDRIELEQHTNGINCLRVELDGKNAGESCPNGKPRGGSRYSEHQKHTFTGFNSEVSGKELKIFITDTPLSNGYAVYNIVPKVKMCTGQSGCVGAMVTGETRTINDASHTGVVMQPRKPESLLRPRPPLFDEPSSHG